jgi:hypothetical protein
MLHLNSAKQRTIGRHLSTFEKCSSCQESAVLPDASATCTPKIAGMQLGTIRIAVIGSPAR